MTQTVLFVLIVGTAVALGVVGARLAGALRDRARIRRRIGGFASLAAADREPEEAVKREVVAMRGGALRTRLDRLYPLAGGVRTVALAALAGVGVAGAAVAAATFFGVTVFIAAVGGVVAGILAGMSLGRMLETAKRNVFEQRFLVAMDDFQRMVYFGIGSQQAFSAISAAAEDPLRGSLRNVAHAAELGMELGQAINAEARRVRVGELAMLAAILSTQARGGGNLSEAIANLSSMLRERLDNRARLRAMTAESRITLIILAIVPVLAIGIQAALQPELVDVLLGDARYLLGIGLGLILGGLLMARMMIVRAQR